MRRQTISLSGCCTDVGYPDADRVVHLRPVAEVDDVREDVRAQPLHKAEALVADAAHVHLLALALPFLVLRERQALHVGVQAPAQALVGRDEDHADALNRVALDQEGVPVFRIGMADMRGDVADLLAVGARVAHALLRLPHLRGRDHFHGLGDLPSVLHTLDLHPDFFCPRHSRTGKPWVSPLPFPQKLPLFFQSSIAAFSAFSSSAERSFLSSMVFTSAAYLSFR